MAIKHYYFVAFTEVSNILVTHKADTLRDKCFVLIRLINELLMKKEAWT